MEVLNPCKKAMSNDSRKELLSPTIREKTSMMKEVVWVLRTGDRDL